MSTLEAGLLFAASLVLTVTASAVLSRRIEQLGKWLLLSESLLGIVAALGADAPEISSSISALRSGNYDLGLGIVLGSNIFNLAVLLGLSALVSGKIRVDRRTLILNGGVALGVLSLTMAQLYGALPNVWALGLISAILVPYVTAIALTCDHPQGSTISRARRSNRTDHSGCESRCRDGGGTAPSILCRYS